MTLVPVDTSSALAVTNYLTQARDWLATCVEMTGPVEIAAARAEIATAAEATKQLHLSKDTRDLSTEMVRRAEFALSSSIKQAKERGELYTQGHGGGARSPYERIRNGVVEQVQAHTADSAVRLPTVKEVAPDLYYNGSELAALADVEPEQFDKAIDEAKAEGNLSRANVVRKVKQHVSPNTRDSRADLIADLAAQGYSSRQMPIKVGVTEESVRKIARDFDIDIPADRSIGRTRRINSTQVVVNTATALEGLLAGIELVDFDDLDLDETGQWAASLTDSVKKLARFAQQIRKATQ